MKYSAILPIYNEETNIPSLYKRLTKVLSKLSSQYEIVCINDGSWDRSYDLLLKLHKKDKKVKLINFSRNFGHQIAVSAGLAHATGDKIAVLDADLQDPPEILPEFFKKLDKGYDVVYAIRKKRKEGVLKKAAYMLFYRILRQLTQTDIPLDSGDFCVMKKRVAQALSSLPERNRFVRGLRSWVGYKQTGIEYERDGRFSGESKYSLRKMFRLAFDGIFSFSYVPLQFMFLIGLISLVLSCVGIILVVYYKYFTPYFDRVPGFATTTILVSFIGGLQMFSIGLMGEYVRRVYDEIKQRPLYIIESAYGFSQKVFSKR